MKVVLYLSLLFTLGANVSGSDSKKYNGYKLITVSAKTRKEAEFLIQLEMDHSGVDFWTGPAMSGPSTLMLPPHLLHAVERVLTREGIDWKEQDADLSQIVEDGLRKTPMSPVARIIRSAGVSDVIDHTSYHRYDKIISYLGELKEKYPEQVEVSDLNRSTHEGRNVAMVKLHSSRIASKRPAIILEAGIHAREWISPAATLYAIETLLQRYHGGDPKAQFMLDSYDWYIVPVTNPDGYEYTHTNDRMWRKNRRKVGWECHGVDLNRNFDVYFGTTGISRNCRSAIYSGDRPFSEPETDNIKDLFFSLQEDIVAYISVHSYSQLLLVPWAFSNMGLEPDNYKELQYVTKEMAAAMKDTHGKEYQVGTVWSLLEYAASGSSMDWAIYNKENLFAMAYELRPNGTDPRGFNLPPDEIIATGQEFLASLSAMAQEITPVGW